MKKLAATLFLTIFAAIAVFGQAPTLTIVTETPNLPSELWYGPPPNGVKVKPVRLRPGTNTPITIADYDFFTQQQYIDMLRRFPEPACPAHNCGIEFYLNLINGYLTTSPCTATDAVCIKTIRGIVGANFFRSPEFQRKGNYVMYLYMVSIGQRPKTVAELPTKNDPALNDRPHYTEFFADLGSISTLTMIRRSLKPKRRRSPTRGC